MQISLLNRLPIDQESILLLQAYEPPEGYYVTLSYGKDSVVMYDLVKRAGVKHTVHYHVTGLDYPELLRWGRLTYPEVIWDRPSQTFWQGVLKNGLPLRRIRWCCRTLKECHGRGNILVDGVRAQESSGRKARSCFEEHHKDTTTHFLHPIFKWSIDDVWQYIDEYHVPHSLLYYDNGKRIKRRRLGCILCPMTGAIETRRQMKLYPRFVELYRNYAQQYIEKRLIKESCTFKTGDEYFNWWITRK